MIPINYRMKIYLDTSVVSYLEQEDAPERMLEPVLSNKFTVEDIRVLRDYNSQRHLKMSTEEIILERKKNTEWFQREMSKRNKKVAVK